MELTPREREALLDLNIRSDIVRWLLGGFIAAYMRENHGIEVDNMSLLHALEKFAELDVEKLNEAVRLFNLDKRAN